MIIRTVFLTFTSFVKTKVYLVNGCGTPVNIAMQIKRCNGAGSFSASLEGFIFLIFANVHFIISKQPLLEYQH